MDKLYQRLLSFTGDGVCRYTFQDGCILMANRGFCRILELDEAPERLIGRRLSEIQTYVEREGRVREALTTAGELHGFEYAFKTLKGTLKWLAIDAFMVKEPDGDWVVEAILKDHTPVKEAERQLRESEQHYRRITEAITDYIYTVRMRDGCPADTVHGAACQLVTGYTDSDFKANPNLWIDMVVPEDRDLVRGQAAECIRGVTPEPIEHRIVRKDGTQRWIRNTPALHVDAQGRLLSYDGVIQDITERKLSEIALRESEAKYRSMMEAMEDLVYICSADYRIEYMNRAMIRRTGYDAVGELCYKAIHSRFDVCPWCVNNLVQQGRSQKWEVTSPQDGRTYHISNTPLFHADGSISKMAVIRDITEFKQAQEALRRSEDKFSRAFLAMPDGVLLARGSDRHVIEVNHAFLGLLGYARERVIGQALGDLDCWGDAGQRARMTDALAKGDVDNLDLTLIGRGGQQVPCQVAARAVELEGEPCALVLVRDVTERKLLEQSRREREKTQAMGALAGGVAQSVNKIVEVIQGAASSIVNRVIPDTPIHADARRILEAAAHATQIAYRLMNVADTTQPAAAPTVAPVELAGAIRGTIELLGDRIASKPVTLGFHTAAPALHAAADARQLVDVLMNVVFNAAEAMPAAGGAVAIELRPIRIVRPTIRFNPRVQAGEFALIRIRDNGAGMSADVLARLFDPFFTTKAPGEAFGLGMTLVQSLINSWGGWVSVRSQPGRGTTVDLFLPCCAAKTPAAAVLPPVMTVLFADDNPVLTRDVANHLKGIGHTVHAALSVAEALAVCEAEGGAMQAAVVDLIMPDGGGRAIIEALWRRNPDATVVVTAGFSRDVMRDLLPGGRWHFVQKPYEPRQITEALYAALA